MKISFSTNKKQDAAIENSVKLPYAAAKRVFPRVRWLLILVVVAAPFLLFMGKILLDWLFVTSPGTIWLDKRTINSSEAGTVEKVFYHKGDMAEPDTVMFRVKRKIPENRIEQIAFLEAERDAAKMGNAGVARSGSAGIELAQQSVAYYEKIRDNAKFLFDQGAATKAELDAAENKAREAKTSWLMMASAAAAPADSSVPAAGAVRMAQVEQSLHSLKKMTEEFVDIKSGQGGKVNSVAVSEGQSFAAGEPLAVVADADQIHIVTYVDPNEFKKISIGTVATVKILGTDRKIKAVVEQPPVVVDNIPNGISAKFYPVNMRGVQIFLKVLAPLQPEETIEGLPVVVEW
ncbi:MAG TPA: HlyD family efflux transporter periplasmic adaptor subunit [Patescibacteria group bacterium]|nr:HlyD family efflux transporter periplasmic adaptor subunit [Patescibacteria group bacterium]